jgi:hypothetical protein
VIIGRYGNTTGRPYTEGRLILPVLKITADVSFLVDTGADRVVVMPLDGTRIGINYQTLTSPIPSIGAGGLSINYQTPAVVVLLDVAGRLVFYSLTALVSSATPATMTLPSLLGRSVLDRCRMTYEPSAAKLELDPIDADAFIAVDLASADATFNVPNRPE